jgi:hypothetical protein
MTAIHRSDCIPAERIIWKDLFGRIIWKDYLAGRLTEDEAKLPERIIWKDY